jgi:hypothetical protein
MALTAFTKTELEKMAANIHALPLSFKQIQEQKRMEKKQMSALHTASTGRRNINERLGMTNEPKPPPAGGGAFVEVLEEGEGDGVVTPQRHPPSRIYHLRSFETVPKEEVTQGSIGSSESSLTQTPRSYASVASTGDMEYRSLVPFAGPRNLAASTSTVEAVQQQIANMTSMLHYIVREVAGRNTTTSNPPNQYDRPPTSYEQRLEGRGGGARGGRGRGRGRGRNSYNA